jgi:aryl-alcohol dehydrogenase-like predicted oxidoreductase
MINKLIIGTVQFGLDYGITNLNGKPSDQELDLIFRFCSNNNINTFDTAQDYGTSESIMQKYKQIYPNFKIITKAKFTVENVQEKLQISLDKFTSIDYFLLHSFSDYNNVIIDQLVEYKKNNLIKKIGVSVYTVEEAITVLQDKQIDVIQIPFNYVDLQWTNEEFFKLVNLRSDLEIHVRSIFLQGLLLNPPTKIPKNISKEDFDYLANIINELTKKLNLTKNELCFAYINSFDWINKFLIGIDNYQHLESNYDIVYKNLKLTQEQIQLINNKTQLINQLICNPSKWTF